VKNLHIFANVIFLTIWLLTAIKNCGKDRIYETFDFILWRFMNLKKYTFVGITTFFPNSSHLSF